MLLAVHGLLDAPCFRLQCATSLAFPHDPTRSITAPKRPAWQRRRMQMHPVNDFITCTCWSCLPIDEGLAEGGALPEEARIWCFFAILLHSNLKWCTRPAAAGVRQPASITAKRYAPPLTCVRVMAKNSRRAVPGLGHPSMAPPISRVSEYCRRPR